MTILSTDQRRVNTRAGLPFMNHRLPSLNLLQSFERAAHHRSFKLAAEELHVTPSAISHQIRKLEDELGIALFERLTREIRLTPAGRDYFQEIHRVFARLKTGTERLHDKFGQKRLRLHVTPFFASELLVPLLPDYQALHPDTALNLESSFGRSYAHPEDVDVSIMFGRGSWPCLHSRRLMTLRMAVVCSETLASSIRPGHYEDVYLHPLIDFAFKQNIWQDWARIKQIAPPAAKQQLTLDSMHSALMAAERGQGITMAPMPIAANWIERSSLINLFEETVEAVDHFYVVTRQDDRLRPKIKGFIDWLYSVIEDPYSVQLQ